MVLAIRFIGTFQGKVILYSCIRFIEFSQSVIAPARFRDGIVVISCACPNAASEPQEEEKSGPGGDVAAARRRD